jgi:exodeoxyribonuclease III
MAFSVVTWNVNSLNVRLEHVKKWAKEAGYPDVICLQETKLVDTRFPELDLRGLGYEHLLYAGEKTYNGVAILSRHPLQDARVGFLQPESEDQTRYLSATICGVKVLNVYVVNGNQVGSDKFHYKMDWLRRLRADLDASCSPDEHVVLCGDFNVAPDDASVWDPFECEGKLLFTVEEREALQRLLDFGLVDLYRERNPFSGAFTWWDYRMRGFEVNRGLRIDHHLVSESLRKLCTDITIWRDVRGWTQPSDHVPVVATFDL